MLWTCAVVSAVLAAEPLAVHPPAKGIILDQSTFEWVREPFLAGPDPAANDLRDLARGADGSLWAATATGLRRWDASQRSWVAVDGWSHGGPVWAVERDSQGRVWIGAWDGLYSLAGAADAKPVRVPEVAGPINVVSSVGSSVLAGGAEGVWRLSDDRYDKLSGNWAGPIQALAASGDDTWIGTPVGLFQVRGSELGEITPAGTRLLAGTIAAEPESGRPLLVDCDVRALTAELANPLATGSPGPRRYTKLHVLTARGWAQWGAVLGPTQWRAAGAPREFAGPAGRCLRHVPGLGLWLGRERGLEFVAEPERGAHLSMTFHSLRWLPHDEIRAIEPLDEGAVAVATPKGASVLRLERLSLAQRAEHYERAIDARHRRPPGLVERCRLERPGDLASWQPIDTDNDGMYTAQYLAAASFRYAVTGDPEARTRARGTWQALRLLQTVTSTSGFFARTVVPADWSGMDDVNRTYTPAEEAAERAGDPRWKRVDVRWRPSADGRWFWKGDTSSDEVTGHFFSYPIFYDLAAEEADRAEVRDHVRRIVEHIIAGGYDFRDTDGQATRWGVWSPDKLNNDPNWQLDRGVNSVELLAYLQVAEHVTGDQRYDRLAAELLEKHGYAANVLAPQSTDPATYTFIDTQLLAMAYHVLLSYETDADRRALYHQSLDAWFTRCTPAAVRFGFTAVTAAALAPERYPLDAATTEWFFRHPLDLVDWTVDNRWRRELPLVHRPYADREQFEVLLDPRERALAKWDANPLGAVAGSDGLSEKCGTFWLLPYWQARFYGLIGPPEP